MKKLLAFLLVLSTFSAYAADGSFDCKITENNLTHPEKSFKPYFDNIRINHHKVDYNFLKTDNSEYELHINVYSSDWSDIVNTYDSDFVVYIRENLRGSEVEKGITAIFQDRKILLSKTNKFGFVLYGTSHISGDSLEIVYSCERKD